MERSKRRALRTESANRALAEGEDEIHGETVGAQLGGLDEAIGAGEKESRSAFARNRGPEPQGLDRIPAYRSLPLGFAFRAATGLMRISRSKAVVCQQEIPNGLDISISPGRSEILLPFVSTSTILFSSSHAWMRDSVIRSRMRYQRPS